MRLRTRLLVLSVSTVALIVTVLFALHLDSLTSIWLNTAVDRSNLTGRQIESLILRRIAETPVKGRGGLTQTKLNWNRTVAADQDLAAMLVEQAAVPSGVVVELNIVGEDGKVLLSSIPSREGQKAPVHTSLASVRDEGSLDRLSAILRSTTDYETVIPMGIPEQAAPVFEVQVLVSPLLLRDKIIPDLRNTAVVSLLALLAAAALAGISAQIALRPVRRIGKAIDTLATGRPLGLSFAMPRAPMDDAEDREVAAVEYKLSLLGAQMQGARRDADQMRTAIGTLVRGVAHEIKNPLNAISLRLETLRMRIAEEVPEAEGEIELVSGEVHRLDRVVRTFLDLNRPMELDIAEFDPVELVSAVLETMRPAATRAGVELQLMKPEKPFTVQADRGLMEQAVLNVVNNAIQAMDSGGLVKAAVVRSMTSGDCEIAITDNGPGMPPAVLERIFDPYFTTKSSGSGIGLAVTKRAMDLHGGRIHAESSPGSGTTMTLSFPVERSSA